MTKANLFSVRILVLSHLVSLDGGIICDSYQMKRGRNKLAGVGPGEPIMWELLMQA